MRTAGARVLREDDYDYEMADREAVLSAWERKSLIDDSPLRTRRFQRREQGRPAPAAEGPPADNVVQLGERRTVTITGDPSRAARPRRRSAAQQQLTAQPDRVALWAVLLGLFLVAVAAGTANAAPL